jgi:hypothetical protein
VLVVDHLEQFAVLSESGTFTELVYIDHRPLRHNVSFWYGGRVYQTDLRAIRACHIRFIKQNSFMMNLAYFTVSANADRVCYGKNYRSRVTYDSTYLDNYGAFCCGCSK